MTRKALQIYLNKEDNIPLLRSNDINFFGYRNLPIQFQNTILHGIDRVPLELHPFREYFF